MALPALPRALLSAFVTDFPYFSNPFASSRFPAGRGPLLKRANRLITRRPCSFELGQAFQPARRISVKAANFLPVDLAIFIKSVAAPPPGLCESFNIQPSAWAGRLSIESIRRCPRRCSSCFLSPQPGNCDRFVSVAVSIPIAEKRADIHHGICITGNSRSFDRENGRGMYPVRVVSVERFLQSGRRRERRNVDHGSSRPFHAARG